MDTVDTPKKEIRNMNVMELIEKISGTTKITALNLWKTNRELTNECVQEMKNIRLLADKSKLRDAVDNIGEAFRVMEMLIETSDKNVKNIEMETLISDDESLTDVSEYDSD